MSSGHGIKFAISVPVARKPLLLLLRTHFIRGGEFATVVNAPYVNQC